MGIINTLFGNAEKKRIIGYGNKNNGMFGSLPIYSKNFEQQFEEKMTIFLYKTKNSELMDSNEKYMSTLRYWYAIPYPKELHLLLIKEEYYIKTDLKNLLSSKTIPQLKELSKTFDISIKGKKDELVSQLENQIGDNDKIALLNESRLYMLSKKGEAFINSHSDFITLAEHYIWNISQSEINEYRRKKGQDASIYDAAESILLKRMNHNLAVGLNNYSFNTCRSFSQLYSETGNTRGSLKFNLGLVLLDINMTRFQNGEFYDSYVNAIESAYSDNSYEILAPGIIKTILDNKSLIDNDLIQEAFESVKKCSKIYLTVTEFKSLINELIEYGTVDEKKYLKLIKDRL